MDIAILVFKIIIGVALYLFVCCAIGKCMKGN